MPIVGRPIWRLTEGKHITKLEITWQLPRQPTQRRGNQLLKKKTLTPATTNGETSKMAESKMAAPMPEIKMAEPALNVAVCTTPTGPPRTPSGHSTPYAEDITTDHSLQGEWKEVVSKKKTKEDRQEVSTTSKERTACDSATAEPISAKEEGTARSVPSGPQQGGEKRSWSYQGVSTSREI